MWGFSGFVRGDDIRLRIDTTVARDGGPQAVLPPVSSRVVDLRDYRGCRHLVRIYLVQFSRSRLLVNPPHLREYFISVGTLQGYVVLLDVPSIRPGGPTGGALGPMQFWE